MRLYQIVAVHRSADTVMMLYVDIALMQGVVVRPRMCLLTEHKEK